MPKLELLEQEWSHFFDVNDLDNNKPTRMTIEASEDECADLARRFAVEGVLKVNANLILSREAGNIVHVKGDFHSTITQSCVVSLELFDSEISEPVEGWFADKDSMVSFAAAKREREIITSHSEVEVLDESEAPEPIIEGCIDLGELVAQHMSLTIPAYPHKEGVEYVGDDNIKIDEKSPLRKNPFEALKDWKEER